MGTVNLGYLRAFIPHVADKTACLKSTLAVPSQSHLAAFMLPVSPQTSAVRRIHLRPGGVFIPFLNLGPVTFLNSGGKVGNKIIAVSTVSVKAYQSLLYRKVLMGPCRKLFAISVHQPNYIFLFSVLPSSSGILFFPL